MALIISLLLMSCPCCIIIFLGYELPVVCKDMHSEVKDIVREHHLAINRHKHWTGFHWDALIPRWIFMCWSKQLIYVESELIFLYFYILYLVYDISGRLSPSLAISSAFVSAPLNVKPILWWTCTKSCLKWRKSLKMIGMGVGGLLVEICDTSTFYYISCTSTSMQLC